MSGEVISVEAAGYDQAVAVLNVLGVPSSAASYAPGQEQAPRALREAGLLDALTESGWQVKDAGDLTLQVWQPDRTYPFAQNLTDASESLRELTAAVATLRPEHEQLLVLGGNCTVALGVCAGFQATGVEPSLLYIDRHFDLNTPRARTKVLWIGWASPTAWL